jgi:serine/threonine protein kinase
MPARQDHFVKPAESTAPEEFGPYIVYERLGVGGMATVHRAKKRGIAGFERGVALKRMLPHLAEDTEFINSFVREAKLVSLLVHPNIAQIYDFGRIGNVYYIAMEHVDGFDVRKMLRYSNRDKEALPLNVVLSILCELCDALEYAHTFVDEHGQPQGIVHRDVSPSNLIVAQSGHLKVIDFGIAKANVRQLHTESGRVKGKLGYMSPEAVSGKAYGPVSDVFSAGVVAHELLTAHPLFAAKTDYETLIRIREAEIPRPSHQNPGVPAALDEVVLAALARDAGRRLQTAGAFRVALEHAAEESGIRFCARDVAEWRARIATAEDPWGSRTSLPSMSSGSRVSPYPEPRNTLAAQQQRPLAPELADPPLRPSQQQQRRDRAVTPLGEDDGDNAMAELSWGPNAVQSSPLHSLTEHDQNTPAPPVMMPAIGAAPPMRRNTVARLAVVVLFTLAAGVAAYHFLLQPKKLVVVPLPPPPIALVKFIVQPADATVLVAGKELGHSSPFETRIEPGVYSISVHRQGYRPWSAEVTLRDAEKQTVRVALEPGVAHISVSSEPVGLIGRLDGKPLEQVTPLEFQVAAGPHQLVVTNAAGITWSQDFNAEVDGKYTFHAPLAGAKRSVTVTRTPPSERVTDRAKRPGAGASRDTAADTESHPAEPDAGTLPPVKPDIRVPQPVLPESIRTTPDVPDPPKAPPLVAANNVTKLSGDIPVIKVNVNVADSAAEVVSKMCIGVDGRVTSVKITKALPEVADELHRTLMGWRYKAYVNSAGQPSPACFAQSFRVVIKRSK